MSGFGAALGKLVDFEFINNISEIENRIEQLKLDDPQEFIDKMNMNLVKVKNNSKKIGTAQRDFSCPTLEIYFLTKVSLIWIY